MPVDHPPLSFAPRRRCYGGYQLDQVARVSYRDCDPFEDCLIEFSGGLTLLGQVVALTTPRDPVEQVWALVITVELLNPGSSVPIWQSAPTRRRAAQRLCQAFYHDPLAFLQGQGIDVGPLMVELRLTASMRVPS